MAQKEIRINQGGLMRCCLDTVRTFLATYEPVEGTIIHCAYCRERMLVKDGVVEWAPKEYRDEAK